MLRSLDKEGMHGQEDISFVMNWDIQSDEEDSASTVQAFSERKSYLNCVL